MIQIARKGKHRFFYGGGGEKFNQHFLGSIPPPPSPKEEKKGKKRNNYEEKGKCKGTSRKVKIHIKKNQGGGGNCP